MKVHDFHEGNRHWQDRFDTRALADRLAGRASDRIGTEEREFIERADMFFLATCDHRGLPTCSYKGGDPGFLRVVNERCLAFPNYDGNGKYQSMGNLLMNPNVGILLIDFPGQQRLRIQGVARVQDDNELLREYPGAQFIIRVDITEVYKNCPRYVHNYQLVERSGFVPKADREAPVPEWKLRGELRDVLPANDPARGLEQG